MDYTYFFSFHIGLSTGVNQTALGYVGLICPQQGDLGYYTVYSYIIWITYFSSFHIDLGTGVNQTVLGYVGLICPQQWGWGLLIYSICILYGLLTFPLSTLVCAQVSIKRSERLSLQLLNALSTYYTFVKYLIMTSK